MSGLIMTLSDDEDDLQQQQSAARPASFLGTTAAERAAVRAKANKLNGGTNGTATNGVASKKKEKSLAEQLAEAEREGENPSAASSSKSSSSASTRKSQPLSKKRKAATAELATDSEQDDENAGSDDDAEPAASFAWDVDATSAVLPSRTILPPSKMFQPFVQTNGQTSLQTKIEKQLQEKEKKLKNKQAKEKQQQKQKKKGNDSDEDMASSSEDDVNSEEDEDESDDDGEDQEGGDIDASDDDDVDAADADHVDSDVDMHEYKDDEVKKKYSDSSSSSKSKSSNPNLIHATPLPKPTHMIQDFASLRLSRPLIRAITEIGWTAPTPVQAQSILPAVGGKDLLVNAVTGSGKTGAFMLPILERLLYRPRRVPLTRVLVLLPTRELAAQCHEVSQQLAKHTDIRICLIVGGLSEKVQEQELRAKPDIILATPGRLIDHLRNTQNVHLEDIEILVLDEADRLLECGFQEELSEIIKECPKGRQTLLFSATLTESVIDLINLSLNEPIRIKIDAYESIVDNLKQEFIRIRGTSGDKDSEKEREAIILSLAKRSFKTKTIIFMQSKQQCHRMSIIFGLAQLKAAELQGNMTQLQRLESLEKFRTGSVDFLLCTDLASRGLDIVGVETVLNMSMPRELRQYIHRVGRTARAGRSGRAVTLVGEGQRTALKELVKKAKDVVHSRIIAPEIIQKYRGIIQQMESDIRGVFEQEGEEKAIRVAEMEANKLTNRVKYEEEIMNRPAKTWFQTPVEKKAAKEKSVKVFGDDDEEMDGGESSKPTKKLTEKQLKRLEALEAKQKLKKKDSLLGLNRAKKRRKMMAIEDEKQMKEAARNAKKYDADDLRSQTLPNAETLPPLTHAQEQHLSRVIGKKHKKEKMEEKQAELGIRSVKEKRRELQAEQLMKAEKKKGRHEYNDGMNPSSNKKSDDSKPIKPTVLHGSNFRFKERGERGSGDDRYKIPQRKKKEEREMKKKNAESGKKASSSKKKPAPGHHGFKSQSKFKRR